MINKITIEEYIRYFKNICDVSLKDRNEYNVVNHKNEILVYKQEAVLNVYEKWVELLLKGKMISEYLLANNCHNVAIYGMGRLGKHLYNEFREWNINVTYVIDKNMSKCSKTYQQVPCYNINSELPFVELIIVTIPSEAESIIEELKKRTGYQIKSISNLLSAINNEAN